MEYSARIILLKGWMRLVKPGVGFAQWDLSGFGASA